LTEVKLYEEEWVDEMKYCKTVSWLTVWMAAIDNFVD